jgi:dUTP pyrophosphatase
MFKNFYFHVELVHPKAKMPTRAYSGDAGLDLYSVETAVLWPGKQAKIGVGIKTEFPEGYYAQIFDRGSMAAKGLVTIAGVIDAGYRGEWLVQVINLGEKVITIKEGEKFAQVVILPVWSGQPYKVDYVNESERGEGKLGSSGK